MGSLSTEGDNGTPIGSRPVERFGLFRSRPVALAAVAFLFIGLAWAVGRFVPAGVDWVFVFRPAAQALLSGASPFSVEGYLNAPWALVPLLPFALLPARIGWGLFTVAGLLIMGVLAVRFGAGRAALPAFLLSPPVVHGLLNGNTDWIALSGLMLPPSLGLFLLATKPQIGIGPAVIWLVEAYRRGGWRRLLWTAGPITAVTLLSFLAYGLWPLRFSRELGLWWNASLWPWSIPFGLYALYVGLRERRVEAGLVASPLLSPYVLLHAWSGALLATVRRTRWLFALVGGLWLWVLVRLLQGAGG
jgi:hypothetical protein